MLYMVLVALVIVGGGSSVRVVSVVDNLSDILRMRIGLHVCVTACYGLRRRASKGKGMSSEIRGWFLEEEHGWWIGVR